MSFDKKALVGHGISIAIFLAISFVYLNPVLDGKVLPTHDIEMHTGAAKELKDFKEKTGENSLWTNSMFGGMPAYQIAASYPNSLFLVKPIYSLLTHGLPKPVNMLFLYFIGFYIMLLSFRVDWRLALAGAIAYGFASYNIIIIDAGHNTKALAIGLAPLVIGAVNMALNSKYWILGSALAGLALGFELKVNHVQITYYLFFILLAMGIAWLIGKIQEGTLADAMKRAAVLIIALILGIGANSGNILTTNEYSKETTRGHVNLSKKQENKSGLPKDYITGWSYGIAETGTLIIPNFHGGGSQNNIDYTNMELYKLAKGQMGDKDAAKYMASIMYWGTQPGTNGPVYLGAIICFLFIFGFIILDNRTKYWILAVTVLAIMLSWGKNFMWLSGLFIDYFPGYNKFRTVTMILAIVQITFPLLAILGLSKLLSGKVAKAEGIKALKWSLGIAGGFALLFALLPGMFFDFIKDGEPEQFKSQQQVLDLIVEGRRSLLKADAIRSLLLILASAGAIWLFITDKLKKNLAYIVFISLIIVDLWPVAARYLGPSKFDKATSTKIVASKVDREIMEDKSLDFRVLNFTVSPFNDASTSFYHKSLGGYHGAKLRRIQELIENQIEGERKAINDARFSNPTLSPVINMFNTKYFIASTKKGPLLIPNQGALGNAWFVPQVKVYETADAEMQALTGFDPLKTATTTTEFADYLSNIKYGTGSIKLVEYKPNYLKYICNADEEGFVVFSEVFYRGNEDWISTIDGKKTDHIRVNYLLRGMKVPAGTSTIEFKFDPPTYHTAETFSLISSLLLVLMLLGGSLIAFKKHKPEEYSETKDA